MNQFYRIKGVLFQNKASVLTGEKSKIVNIHELSINLTTTINQSRVAELNFGRSHRYSKTVLFEYEI